MKAASTEWREAIGADEDARHAQLAEDVRHWQDVKNGRWGKGRFLHRKPLLSASATLSVHDNLPEAARFGIFAQAGTLPARVRLSNGAPDIQANTKPDIRGFAVKVLEVSGPAALGGEADHQDFLLINHDVFAAKDSAEFIEVAVASARSGELGTLLFLVRRYGVRDGLRRIKLLLDTLARPFAGYNAERFTTAAPIAVGPYAAKLHLTPKVPRARVDKDNARDMAAQLTSGPLDFDVALQFYVDEAVTPIEDPRVAWSMDASPPVTVATLSLLSTENDVTTESLAFDPWGGLMAHRPLGEVMRARRQAYRASQLGRLGRD